MGGYIGVARTTINIGIQRKRETNMGIDKMRLCSESIKLLCNRNGIITTNELCRNKRCLRRFNTI